MLVGLDLFNDDTRPSGHISRRMPDVHKFLSLHKFYSIENPYIQHYPKWVRNNETEVGLILGFHPADERHRYIVTPSLIGWAQT